jgi:hypothetical protein
LSSFSKPSREYINQNNLYLFYLAKKNERDQLISTSIVLKKKFYLSLNLFFCIYYILKTKMDHFSNIFFIFMSIFIKKNKKKLIKFFYSYSYNIFFIVKNIKSYISSTSYLVNNISFSIYIVLIIRHLLNIILIKYYSVSCSISVLKSFLKQFETKEKKLNFLLLKDSKFGFESKCNKIIEVLKLKNIFHFDNN